MRCEPLGDIRVIGEDEAFDVSLVLLAISGRAL
jgi:hypothetical protein